MIVERQEEAPAKRVDPFSFAAIPVLVGIPRPSSAEPVIYRLEGSRAGLSVRVLRIGQAQERPDRLWLSRDESGPRIIAVPPR